MAVIVLRRKSCRTSGGEGAMLLNMVKEKFHRASKEVANRIVMMSDARST